MMWQFLVAVILTGHGLIHLMGFVVYARLGAVEGLSYPSRLLGGHLGADPAVVRPLGLVWLVAAFGFVAAAGGLATDQGWWRPVVVGTAALSILVSALGCPDARAGVLVSAAILAAVLIGTMIGSRLALVR